MKKEAALGELKESGSRYKILNRMSLVIDMFLSYYMDDLPIKLINIDTREIDIKLGYGKSLLTNPLTYPWYKTAHKALQSFVNRSPRTRIKEMC